MSKGDIPIPHVWWPGFSRSWAATPIATRSSRWAIFEVSAIAERLPALDDLDPVAVRVAHEAQPRAAVTNGVGRALGLDPLLGQAGQRRVELARRDRDVPVAGADLVRLGLPEVEGQLEAGLVAVLGQPHEHVHGLVPDRQPALLLEAERLVERHRAVDVAYAVTGVDQAHVRDEDTL